MSPSRHIHFVTGKLAAELLTSTVETLSDSVGFAYSIEVLPISVAALMTPAWIARDICVPDAATEVMIPGYCDGDLGPLAQSIAVPVAKGPRDIRELPQHYGRPATQDYGQWTIEILAEINHATKMSVAEVVRQAELLRTDGADVIDVGCVPAAPSAQIADYVRALCDAGHRVSIDSFDSKEIGAACAAGAELVLSVNQTNVDMAADWGVEVVAIPDEIATMGGLDYTIDRLTVLGVPYRVDPILEPIGCGFAASLKRFFTARAISGLSHHDGDWKPDGTYRL